MWTCPKCQRVFRNRNQLHTCRLVDKDLFFQRRPPHFIDLYEKIKAEVRGWGEIREEAVLPDVIFFKTKSTFLAIKVKKAWLEIEFFLDYAEEIHPVKKHLQTSKNRFTHIVSIDCDEDINDQLMDWIKTSYSLIEDA